MFSGGVIGPVTTIMSSRRATPTRVFLVLLLLSLTAALAASGFLPGPSSPRSASPSAPPTANVPARPMARPLLSPPMRASDSRVGGPTVPGYVFPSPGPSPIYGMSVNPVVTGQLPFPSVYDASDGEVYVVNTASQDVSVLWNDRVVASVNIGGNASFPAYDPRNGYVYVPDRVAGNVSILDGTQVVVARSTSAWPPGSPPTTARTGTST